MRPTVYGYIRLDGDDEAVVDRLHGQLAAHAEAEGLALAEVFVDRNMAPARIVRPGLTVLLDAVLRTEGCGVLVVSPEHLSPSPAVRQAIEVEIEVLGARLLTITPGRRGAEPHCPAPDAFPEPRSA